MGLGRVEGGIAQDVRRLRRRGGNFIDTANRYTEGSSERYVGEFIAGDRDKYVVATKYTLFTRRDDPNASGNSRKNMTRSLDASLKRLGTDYIDLYWLHAWDFMTPVDEVLRALDDARARRKDPVYRHFRYTGVDCRAGQYDRRAAGLVAIHRPADTVQSHRADAERDLLPMARTFDIAVTAWSVLGSGVLSGKYNRDTAPPGAPRRTAARPSANLAIAAELQSVAEEAGCTASQAAINWVRAQKGVILPILGARSLEQLQDNLGCLHFALSEEHRVRLNQASAIAWASRMSSWRPMESRLTTGGYGSQIDNHRL